jgi:hypothetical protein
MTTTSSTTRPTVADRLRAGYVVDPVTGCHVWQRAKNSKGYAEIHYEGRVELGHRVAFLLKRGRWPRKGLVLDHVECDNPPCVNADHVAERTNGQNIMRGTPRGDEATERRRTRQRAATQRYRARRQAVAGGDPL